MNPVNISSPYIHVQREKYPPQVCLEAGLLDEYRSCVDNWHHCIGIYEVKAKRNQAFKPPLTVERVRPGWDR